MDERDAQFGVPEECRVWCRAQQYGVTVLDDMAVVDLDWWNHHLAERGLAVRLAGRTADGAPTHHGPAVIARGDLTTASATGIGALGEVGVLYAAAAWLSAHRDRDRARRFNDVRTPGQSGDAYDAIRTALHACRHADVLSAPPIRSGRRRWSGWPHAPGVGPTVLSLYCWATHHRTPSDGSATARRGVVCPQLLDQQAVNSLIHLGWAPDPVVARFTWARYTRYCHLLHTWAADADVATELIEMWLVARWRERTAPHSPAPGGIGEAAH